MLIGCILFLAATVSLFAGGKAGEVQQKEAVGERYEWTNRHGTFVLSERIANKVARGEQLDFVSSTIDPAAPFAQFVRLGIERAADEFPIKYRMIGPVDSVSEKQLAELETLIKSEQVDGLAIATWDPNTIIPIFKMAWESGIPAINFTGDSPNSPRLAFVGPSHHDIGERGAKAFIKLHPSKTGKLAIFAAFPTGVYAVERFAGFFDTLDAAGYNLTVVGPFELTLDESKGYGVVENTFLANPDIEAVYMPDEYIVVPAEYAKRNNLTDDVIIIGVNEFPSVLNYVEQGIVKHTTGNNVMMCGYLPGKILYEFVTTGQTTEERPPLELIDITPENVEEFKASVGME
jgi:simple sugar transport system substrate-binding protein/ribose transport system substrate-binding protein